MIGNVNAVSGWNICIAEDESSDVGFKISFIDFEESFLLTDKYSANRGKGNRRFMAHEFFKNDDDFNNRLNTTEDEHRLILKDNFRDYFSYESDIFALGYLLKEELGLIDSRYHNLLVRMCMNEPSERPTGSDIMDELVSYLPKNGI